MKDPKKITLLDIVKTIDGDDIFINCIIHNDTCNNVNKNKVACALHDDYSAVRSELIRIFSCRTIHELVQKVGETEKIVI
jgi:Rrf2 family iron-sulfur cluster assembly transcriptional regulator